MNGSIECIAQAKETPFRALEIAEMKVKKLEENIEAIVAQLAGEIPPLAGEIPPLGGAGTQDAPDRPGLLGGIGNLARDIERSVERCHMHLARLMPHLP